MSTITTGAGGPARRGNLTGRCRARLAGIADRVHASGDARARAAGWTVTATPGRFGLSGRTYRDPRFGRPTGAACPEGTPR
jgi:hypothetical protein